MIGARAPSPSSPAPAPPGLSRTVGKTGHCGTSHLLRLGSFLLDDSDGGGAPSRDRLGTAPHHHDLWLGGRARPCAPYLSVQLRTKLEIAKGEPRIPQTRRDDACQLRLINIERGSQDALEER
jgi:hypothetical protein